MPNWLAKAVIQKTISLVPGGRALNHALQTRVTHSLDLDRPQPPYASRFDQKLAQCRRHMEHYAARATAGRPFTALELGTGWHPIVPVGLHLCGARDVWTIDQEALLTLQRVRDVIARFITAAAQPDWTRILPLADPRRVAALPALLESPTASAHELLEEMDIHAITGDARSTGLPAASIDLIVSNNTLEHIAAPELRAILTEFRRIAAPTAVMSHYIDLADHYVHFDAALSPYNFLRFSPRLWRLLDNSLQPMNRLRISDYRRMHAESGFAVVSEDSAASSAALLAGVPLARDFRAYAPEDVAVTASWLVSAPGGAHSSPHGA